LDNDRPVVYVNIDREMQRGRQEELTVSREVLRCYRRQRIRIEVTTTLGCPMASRWLEKCKLPHDEIAQIATHDAPDGLECAGRYVLGATDGRIYLYLGEVVSR
jgi:hypothetical protein